MNDFEMKSIKGNIILISTFTGVIVTAVFIFIFAAVMYFLELDKMYSVIFATISVALGCFSAAYVASYKNKSKGFLIGLTVGGITFAVILLISLIVDKGAIGINTIFHFIIFMLSAIIGGVMGVNKANNTKYIK